MPKVGGDVQGIPEQCSRNQHVCAQVGGTGGISCRYRASLSDQRHVQIDAMSSDISTASTFVTQVVEEDSVQLVAIFGRVEEVNRGANHVHVFQEVPPVFRARRSDTARRLPSKFV